MVKRSNTKSNKQDNASLSRPMPLPKIAIAKVKNGPGMAMQIKKIVFGAGGNTLDAHQKKMAVLVVILFCVLGGVLFVTMGGSMSPRAATAHEQTAAQQVQTQSAEDILKAWHDPETLTQNLRNITEPVTKIKPVLASQPAKTVKIHEDPNTCIVNGIVFSKIKPSAVVNHKIVYEGQSINGIKVIKISRNTVKFQAGDKQWVQSVQSDIQ